MPHADNQGVRIHYRVEGEGPPLVLQHGMVQSIEDWYEFGYVEALSAAGFRPILIDARGYGQSDKPHDPAAYGLDLLVADITAVLDALDLAKAHFWGFSMGGWIGFGMARYAVERVDRLVVGSSHPYARNQERVREFYNAHLDDSADDFVAAIEGWFGVQVSPARKVRLGNLDRHALLAWSQDRAELSDMLSNMRMPCCLYAGEADPLCEPAKRASALIPGALFFALPGLGHAGAFRSSDQVLPRVIAFLRGRP